MAATEIARLKARPGMEDALARQLPLALGVVIADPGCRRAVIYRGIEDPGAFVCETEWTSVAAHEAWRDSPNLAAYRALIGDLEGQPIEFAHYEIVFEDGAPTPGG